MYDKKDWERMEALLPDCIRNALEREETEGAEASDWAAFRREEALLSLREEEEAEDRYYGEIPFPGDEDAPPEAFFEGSESRQAPAPKEEAAAKKAARQKRREIPGLIRADALIRTDFPPLTEPVEGFICEGLTLLVGGSKIGKSFLVLDMCLSVAKGTDFLGRKTRQGSVLYFALEDSSRRLKERLLGMETEEIPEDLHLATSAKPLFSGLEEEIEGFIESVPDTRLIVIDTLQKIRPITAKGQNAYQADYRDLGALKAIADRFHVALVLVHHTNKMRHVSDSFDRISGSSAIMGAADTTILMQRERGSNEATIRYTGRDVYGEDFCLRFYQGRWHYAFMAGEAEAETEKSRYETEPLVRLFRSLSAEHPKGGRFSYTKLRALGKEKLGFFPFLDGRDCQRKLRDGLLEELAKRDGIRLEVGMKMGTNRGVLLLPNKEDAAVQTMFTE